MPKAAPPKTPFSTPLSGSARETEDRIRNIFQYQKKRPPVLALLLACALALLCGGLVSCETQSPAPSLSQEEEQLLEDMLGELWLRHQAEQEAAFRAALTLCRELNRAVLA